MRSGVARRCTDFGARNVKPCAAASRRQAATIFCATKIKARTRQIFKAEIAISRDSASSCSPTCIMRENLRVIRQFGRGRGAPAAVALAGRGAGEQWCVWFVHVKVLNMYMCARAFGRSSGGLCVFCDPTKVAVMEPDKRRALSCILVAAAEKPRMSPMPLAPASSSCRTMTCTRLPMCP